MPAWQWLSPRRSGSCSGLSSRKACQAPVLNSFAATISSRNRSAKTCLGSPLKTSLAPWRSLNSSNSATSFTRRRTARSPQPSNSREMLPCSSASSRSTPCTSRLRRWRQPARDSERKTWQHISEHLRNKIGWKLLSYKDDSETPSLLAYASARSV